MDWTAKIYSYCERGGDPGFWAEPLNAISNGAFVIAGVIAAVQLMRAPRTDHTIFEWALVVLVLIIGTGSFLFHTYATRWAVLADTIPISLFMLAYLGYALCRFLKMPWIGIALALGLFYVTIHYAQGITCSNELLPITRAAGKRCLNGTLSYVPAFGALVLVGAALLWHRHPAAPYLLTAAVVFLASMTLRTIDIEVCQLTRGLGTHVLWHILNAVLLYVLLLGAIRHGGPEPAVPIASGGRSVP
jgi:hypothetical protein